MKQNELAKKFLNKAEEDLILIHEIMNNTKISDEIYGFHCQQAAEKILKGVLANYGIEFRKTHDIRELVDLLIDNGIQFPEELEDIDMLTPFAVEYRYDFYGEEYEEKLDRMELKNMLEKLKKWAYEIIFKNSHPQ